MSQPKQERRFLSASAPAATGRTVSGYAALFNVRSQNMGSDASPFHEIILPGAFDDVLTGDVVSLFNHNPDLILARSNSGKGTLALSVDSVGLKYQFEAPETTVGNDLLESIKRGDVCGSSFAFTVADGGDTWTPEGKGTLRTITKIGRLYDASPVVNPAYADTTVTARGMPQDTPEHPSVTNARRFFDLL